MKTQKTYAESVSPALARLFANLENGNVSDAKAQAKRYSSFRLSMYARQVLCWSFARATTAAAYLKGKGTFQAYCDAE